MADSEYVHGTLAEGEQNPVVTKAQAKRTSHVAVKSFDVARPRAGVSPNTFEKAHGSFAINSADICDRLVKPLNSVRQHYRSSSG